MIFSTKPSKFPATLSVPVKICFSDKHNKKWVQYRKNAQNDRVICEYCIDLQKY